MKKIKLVVFLVSLVVVLSACGGGGGGGVATYGIGVTVSGVNGTLVLQNNGSDDMIINSNGQFTFVTRVTDEAQYRVSIKTQPAGQICSLRNSSGTIIGADVTNIEVTCVTILGEAIPLPYDGSVDKTQSLYKLIGLSANSPYTVSIESLTDNADLYVYSDPDFTELLCMKLRSVTDPELCNANSNASGELYITVSGNNTSSGANFVLDATPINGIGDAIPLYYPTNLPYGGRVERTSQLYEVSGLTSNSVYKVYLMPTLGNADLYVYSNSIKTQMLCVSSKLSTDVEQCTAQATPSGSLYIEVDGYWTTSGTDFTLEIYPDGAI